jgi:hypothetical protein
MQAMTSSGLYVRESYDYDLKDFALHENIVRKLCEKLNWSGELLSVDQGDSMLWVFLTFCDSRANAGGIPAIPIHQGTRITV